MPPIVALTLGEPLVSMVPVLLKPLPLIVYATGPSVTPAAAFKFSASDPLCSPPLWLRGSLAQPALAALAASASDQIRGILPSFVKSPDALCQRFIEQSFFTRRPGCHGASVGRPDTGFDGHGQSPIVYLGLLHKTKTGGVARLRSKEPGA